MANSENHEEEEDGFMDSANAKRYWTDEEEKSEYGERPEETNAQEYERQVKSADEAKKLQDERRNRVIDEAQALQDERKQRIESEGASARTEPSAAATPADSASAYSFGVVKNDPYYEISAIEARQRSRREAARAARVAEAEKRREMLESGRYFDDGRGNLRLKKQFRQTVERRGRGFYNETLPDDGGANAAIREAGQSAFDKAMNWEGVIVRGQEDKAAASRQYTQNIVAANRVSMEEMEKKRAERKINDAKGRLSVFDGLVAAFGDMNRKFDRGGPGDITEEEVTEQPRERFKRDAQGRITTELAEPTVRKTGRRFMQGFVSEDVVKTINSRLAELGNNRVRITGIMARQQLGVDDKTKEGEPLFYVSGKHYDPKTGTNKPFLWKRTLKDVYRFGVENGEASGLSPVMADETVIDALGDVFGNRARKNMPSEKEQIELKKLQEGARQFDATLAANRDAKREQMRSQFVGDAVQSITRMLKDQGVADDKVGEMVQTQLSSMLEQYDRAMGGGGSGGAPAPQGDGTIVGEKGGAPGSGGKGQPKPAAEQPAAQTTQGQPKPAAEQAAEALKRRGKAVQGGGNSAAPSPQTPNPEAPKVEEGSEADLVAKEVARRRAFNGELVDYEDGSVRYKIRNWDYLPQDLKDHVPERGKDLDDLVLDAQKKADAAKKAFDERFNDEVKPGIEADARKKFPNNAVKRRKFVEEEVRKWRLKNDPVEARRHKEYAENVRWAAFVSDY